MKTTDFGPHWRGVARPRASVLASGGQFSLAAAPSNFFLGFDAGAVPAEHLRRNKIAIRVGLSEQPVSSASTRRLAKILGSDSDEMLEHLRSAQAELRESVPHFSNPKGIYSQFADADRFNRATGLMPNLGFLEDSELARHEAIHSAHYANPENPFFAAELQKAPRFGRLLDRDRLDVRAAYSSQLKGLSKPARKMVIQSERLAYANQGNATFLDRAERAGVKTLRSASQELQVLAKQSRLGDGNSVVSGLARAVKQIGSRVARGL